MATIAELAVGLTLVAEAYHKGLEAAASDAEGKSQSITQSLSNIGKGIVFGAGALIAGGVSIMGEQLVESVKDASKLQDAQGQLNSVLANTGSITGVTAEQVAGLAEKYSGLTKFSDLQITSADAVLARFKNISSDAFPAANMAAMNLATTMGTDLPSAAQLLGKILEQPGTAMMRLRAAGVEVTPELDKMLKKMAATGDTAGAQKTILDALNNSIGGVALAAGDTASGGIAEMNNKFEEIREKVGGALLPALQVLEKEGLSLLRKPEVQAAITNLTKGITSFVQTVATHIPQAIAWFQNMVGFLQTHQGIIVAILAILGVSVAAFAVTAVISIGSVVIAALPIIAVLALIAGAAYLLYQAWQTDWGGIREKTAAAWAWLQQAFTDVRNWLQVNIPAALAFLTNAWTNVLLPAIKAVWSWLNTVLFPFFTALANFLSAVFSLALRALTGIWQNELLPALKAVWDFMSPVLLPLFKEVSDYMSGSFLDTVRTVADWLSTKLAAGFDWVTKAIGWVIGKLNDLTAALNSIHLPSWMTPGSPTPWELGLIGIGSAMNELSSVHMPALNNMMGGMRKVQVPGLGGQTAGGGIGHQVNNNQKFTFQYQGNATPQQVYQGYEMARLLG